MSCDLEKRNLFVILPINDCWLQGASQTKILPSCKKKEVWLESFISCRIERHHTEPRRSSKQFIKVMASESSVQDTSNFPRRARMATVLTEFKSMTSFFGSTLETVVMPKIQKQCQIQSQLLKKDHQKHYRRHVGKGFYEFP